MSGAHETVLSPILARLDALEAENAALRAKVEELDAWAYEAQADIDAGRHWDAITSLAGHLGLEWDDATLEMVDPTAGEVAS